MGGGILLKKLVLTREWRVKRCERRAGTSWKWQESGSGEVTVKVEMVDVFKSWVFYSLSGSALSPRH